MKLKAPKHTFLSLFLIEERWKGEESFWYPYLESLPKSLDSMPIFYSEEELGLLKGSPFLRKIANKKNELFKDYTLLADNIEEFKQRVEFEEYAYFRCISSSRVFGFFIEGERTGGLVPFVGK